MQSLLQHFDTIGSTAKLILKSGGSRELDGEPIFICPTSDVALWRRSSGPGRFARQVVVVLLDRKDRI